MRVSWRRDRPSSSSFLVFTDHFMARSTTAIPTHVGSLVGESHPDTTVVWRQPAAVGGAREASAHGIVERYERPLVPGLRFLSGPAERRQPSAGQTRLVASASCPGSTGSSEMLGRASPSHFSSHTSTADPTRDVAKQAEPRIL